MLSNIHFYHRVTRKMVVAFGTLFNNIRLVRYNKAGTQEIERINVPLQYAQKEKFYQRITQDPELTKEVQITLPRMSFELTAITYDPLRKRNLFTESFSPETNSTVKSIRTTPYNFEFELNIYVRNTEDGTQIVEQILPYFNPDYNLTLDIIGLADQKVDVPFILQNVTYSVDDVGTGDTTRVLIWTLTFTAKGYMFGPIVSRDVIRKATANTYNSIFELDNKRSLTMNASTGTGNYQAGELVFEGRTLSAANATGFVDSWSNTTKTLIVSDVNGILRADRYLTGAVTNTAYKIQTFNTADSQLSKLVIVPNPITANAQTAFGFDETILEFPNIS
jgi:hypothetical protein